MSTKIILPQQYKPPQDRLRAAFARLHRHSTFTYREVPTVSYETVATFPSGKVESYNALPLAPDLPESKPARSFTELFKAAILRGLRGAR